jgi:hypothetical protein
MISTSIRNGVDIMQINYLTTYISHNEFNLFKLGFLIILLTTAPKVFSAGPVLFKAHTISTEFNSGYQVLARDMNNDGRVDLIALDSRNEDLLWFENPGWERKVLTGGMSRMINMDVCGDDIVVAQRFTNVYAESVGEIVVISANGNKQIIDTLPTSHRIRCASISPGQDVVVNAPLIGEAAVAPEFQDNVPLVYYTPGDWTRQLISEENEGVTHGIYIHDLDDDGHDEILTASFSGIHAFSNDGDWQRTELARGYPGQWPEVGASDVAVGEAEGRYIATIEPWHGHQVVVYRDGVRDVLDDSLVQGHTLSTADLNNDGIDEIIAGYRGPGQSVLIYYYDNSSWQRVVLDGGDMSAASCTVADLNNDTFPDIACIGRTTQNLKWYENRGQ